MSVEVVLAFVAILSPGSGLCVMYSHIESPILLGVTGYTLVSGILNECVVCVGEIPGGRRLLARSGNGNDESIQSPRYLGPT